MFKLVPPSRYEPNALIEGYVLDAENGKPVSGVEVLLEGAGGVLKYRTTTDERGYYSIRFYAHRYSDTGVYHGYCLVVAYSERPSFLSLATEYSIT